MAHRLSFWEDKNVTFEESKKYSSRMEFYKKAHGAYVVSKDKGWLDEMTWLNSKNVYTDPVDTVYKYHFINENAVYIGRGNDIAVGTNKGNYIQLDPNK